MITLIAYMFLFEAFFLLSPVLENMFVPLLIITNASSHISLATESRDCRKKDFLCFKIEFNI